jgi:plasmid stabilization system protein ParE
MVELQFSIKASADLYQIITDLAGNAGMTVSAQYSRKFDDLFDRIQQFPQQCVSKTQLGPHARVCVVYPYLVIYDHLANHNKIVILRILHGRQKLSKRKL